MRAEIDAMVTGAHPRNDPLVAAFLESSALERAASLLGRVVDARRFGVGRRSEADGLIPAPSAWLPPAS